MSRQYFFYLEIVGYIVTKLSCYPGQTCVQPPPPPRKKSGEISFPNIFLRGGGCFTYATQAPSPSKDSQFSLNVRPNLIQCSFITKQSYHKIPKISPAAYIFQRPFMRNLFLEGLIFRGAYLRRDICVSKSIGLALQLDANLPFLLCFTLYLRAISRPQGAYIQRGNLTEGFQRYRFGGLIFGGAYTSRGLFSEFYGILHTAIKQFMVNPSYSKNIGPHEETEKR